MKCRIQTTLVADQDIRDIITFISLDRPEAAQVFAQELWAAFDRVSAFPESGVVIHAIGENIRYVRVSSRFADIWSCTAMPGPALWKSCGLRMVREIFRHFLSKRL